jgi:hypothetical protein
VWPINGRKLFVQVGVQRKAHQRLCFFPLPSPPLLPSLPSPVLCVSSFVANVANACEPSIKVRFPRLAQGTSQLQFTFRLDCAHGTSVVAKRAGRELMHTPTCGREKHPKAKDVLCIAGIVISRMCLALSYAFSTTALSTEQPT